MSIQAEDIKFIGSWLHHNDEWSSKGYNGYFRWEIEDWFLYAECCIDLENVSPILLTEEILLGCGFVDVSNYKDYELRLPPHDELTIEISFRDGKPCYSGISDMSTKHDIQYVHQLQQLYHSLTGKELDIKL